MPNYEIKINRAIKQFTPKLIILGLTDNDICSLKYEKNISDTKRYKDFLNYNKQSLLNYLIYNPKSVFINWTGTGKTLYSFYQNYFKHTEIVKKYKKFFKKYNKDTDDYLLNCSKELKKWIYFVSQKLNSQNVKFLVVSLPNPRRVLNYSKGNKHYGYENVIRFLNVNSLNNYYFINTIDNLSKYKENNYNLEKIIVPSDGHYNFQANNIISDMIFNKIRNKNILEK